MREDETALNLTRRQILGGLGVIGVSAAGAGYGTTAFFGDQETFENNRLVAGELDMRVGFEEHYSNWSANEGDRLNGSVTTSPGGGTLNDEPVGLPTQEQVDGSPLIALANASDARQFLNNTAGESPDPGDDAPDRMPDGFDALTVRDEANPCSTELLVSGVERPTIRLSDLKPGDFGEVTFSFALCDNPGFVWLTGRQVSASEGGVTEPEADDPDEGSGVELLDAIETAVWVDDGNNYQNGGESLAASGALREVLTTATPGDGAGNVGQNRTGIPLSGDLPAEEGGGRGRNCFTANTAHSVVFAWWLPVDHANEVQSDAVTFDLGFYTEQCRHNAVEGGITGFETFSSTTATFAREGGAFVIEANGAGMFETADSRSDGDTTGGSP